MSEIETIKPTDLVLAARDAYAETNAEDNRGREHERITQIIRIGERLAAHGIEPVGDPFTNQASGKVCVPIVRGGWDEESESQVHTVAVESAGAGKSLPLVADSDLDEDWDPRRLYPAGQLDGLADVGRAIANGGQPPRMPVTAHSRVNAILSRATARSDDASGVQTCLEAVCAALMDIADAIRETGTAV